MSAPFHFKEFTIEQENCAMKVGTDGVLLGAWSSIRNGAILDIGTGTGLIALMMAQRTQNATIDAIEIEKHAFQQAKTNVNNSKWSNKVNVYHSALQSFFPTKQYDLIISNPPFFSTSFLPSSSERAIARHTMQLSFDELILNVVRLLKIDGIFSIILPIELASNFEQKAQFSGLFIKRKCEVKPNLIKPVKRILVEFSKTKFATILTEQLIIETEKRHHYSEEYKKLTFSFYL